MTDASGSAAAGGASARTAVASAARDSWGRLVALLAAPTRDLALAEDALATALEQALTTWAAEGVPRNPEAWLLTVARNRIRDHQKAAAQRTAAPLEEADMLAAPDEALEPDEIPDQRLALLFVCAHPAIDPGVRTPLMLQTVLGLEADRVARAFAVPASAMAQRLVRAKRRIRVAGIPFAVPDRGAMPDRLPPVLEAVYGAYAVGFQAADADGLPQEALRLATLLAELLTDEPEAFGLAALLALSLARSPATPPGGFVPLDEQDAGLWDAGLVAQGEALLRRASRFGRVGRFQLEAAIQSVHDDRRRTGVTDHAALRRLYEALVVVAPTLGARVALAAAVGRTDGADAGLAALDGIGDPRLERFQPAWATRARLLEDAGRPREAVAAYERAAMLTLEDAVRTYLVARADRIR